ncbi:hypothetical protein C791_2291 [Amycolatopsis azurea DSM 43854]|uniref:Uncharacterized protein n=1 Tax=Amycolatopsis azurea DSM 43854 TaxID=1238180 RepID=M2NXE9_9PSEU|nr:hypothetical protein C791_2291 [Amycolatopsis azurea DSM 43854]
MHSVQRVRVTPVDSHCMPSFIFVIVHCSSGQAQNRNRLVAKGRFCVLRDTFSHVRTRLSATRPHVRKFRYSVLAYRVSPATVRAPYVRTPEARPTTRAPVRSPGHPPGGPL